MIFKSDYENKMEIMFAEIRVAAWALVNSITRNTKMSVARVESESGYLQELDGDLFVLSTCFCTQVNRSATFCCSK